MVQLSALAAAGLLFVCRRAFLIFLIFLIFSLSATVIRKVKEKHLQDKPKIRNDKREVRHSLSV
jgi:Na+-transporting methylmalonyl-CoA/oxaloacetate decarboxylase gamma subunit